MRRLLASADQCHTELTSAASEALKARPLSYFVCYAEASYTIGDKPGAMIV